MDCNSKYAKVWLCFELSSEALKAETSEQDKDSKMLLLLWLTSRSDFLWHCLRLHGVTLLALDWDCWRQARIWLASSLNTGQSSCPSIRLVIWSFFMHRGVEMLSGVDSYCDQISCHIAPQRDCWRQARPSLVAGNIIVTIVFIIIIKWWWW